ncbi:MAG: trypsin-like serine peptidase, partial [Flavobacteriales bacterium]
MKHLLSIFTLVFAFAMAEAQISQGGEPNNWGERSEISFEELSKLQTNDLDFELIRLQDEMADQHKDIPYRFGIEVDTEIDIVALSDKEVNSATNEVVCYYGVTCPEASSISFLFSDYYLPKGARLFIWNSDRTKFIGSFNHLNNKDWGKLAVGLIHSNEVVIELQADNQAILDQVGLTLGKVIHGYRHVVSPQLESELGQRGPFGNSGNCNINVNCPEGEEWQVEKKSVGLIVDGGFASCTGALVNNTAQDGTPYFLTANHCLGGQNNWVFYFNHETAGCTGNTGPTNQSVSGSVLRASNGGSDFALLELSQTPPEDFEVQYAGWDNSDNLTVTSAVGIHHPSGDLKKICFENDDPYHQNVFGAACWYIDEWEDGVTEGGSSGSPLFDQNHRIIGQLYGGGAACQGTSNNGQPDWYGRFGVSWDGNSSSTRLRDWLDPSNTGATVLDGWPIGAITYENDAAIGGIANVDPVICGSSTTPVFTLTNSGNEVLTSATIQFILNGMEFTIPWTGELEQNESEEVELPILYPTDGENYLVINVLDPNGLGDENDSNNSTEISFQAVTGPSTSFVAELILDNYGTETTWEIVQNNTVYYSGGPYSNGQDGELVSTSGCL